MAGPSIPDLPEPPQSAVAPERTPPAMPAGDVLPRLARLVAERAECIASAPEAASAHVWLDLLKQALSALEHHLDALELLRHAETPGWHPVPNASFSRPASAVPAPPDRMEGRGADAGVPPRMEDPHEVARAAAAENAGDASGDGSDDASGDGSGDGSDDGSDVDPSASSEAPRPRVRVIGPQRDYPPFRDQLTGLHSRDGFDAVAAGDLKRCRRHGRLFSLLLFRLPGTDSEGLRRAANGLRTATRESDLSGRHLDRTLAVALPETPATEARIVAERIIRHLEGVGAWDAESRVGLVTHPAHGETLVQLVEAARAQLAHPPRQVLAATDREGWPG